MLDVNSTVKKKLFIVQTHSPGFNREDPGGVDPDRDTFSPRPGPDVPSEGGAEESFKTVRSLADYPADKLSVNLLIAGRLYHPNYLPVPTVDVEMSSLVRKYL